MRPPYTITPNILSRVEQVGEAIGRAEAAGISQDSHTRRSNRIRAIRGSLAIEGNILSEEQVATILDGKPVAAPLKDIQGVQFYFCKILFRSGKRIPAVRPRRRARFSFAACVPVIARHAASKRPDTALKVRTF